MSRRISLRYARKEPSPRSLFAALRNHCVHRRRYWRDRRTRRYWRDFSRTLRYALDTERKLRHWCETRRTRRKCLGRTGKTSVYKRVGIPQKVSEPTPWQESWSLNLRHGGILSFYLRFHLQPGFESWYLPQGPSPTPQMIHAQVVGILCKELGLQKSCRFCSKNDGPPVFHCLNQPESSNDKSFAQEVEQKITSAVYDCMKRIQLEIVCRMIKRNGERSDWVSEGYSRGCSVGHPEGDLYGTLPCQHVRCMHCEIELTMKADNDRKCGECGKPYDIIPFSTRFRSQFIESQ